MEDMLKHLVNFNDKLSGLPSGVLTVAAAIVVGYVLKCIKKFPNSAIPVVVIFFAALAFVMASPADSGGMLFRVWLIRNICIGLVLGLIAWLLHKSVLKRLERRLGLFQNGDDSPEADPPADKTTPTPAAAPREKETTT